jgi:hypothetical protein
LGTVCKVTLFNLKQDDNAAITGARVFPCPGKVLHIQQPFLNVCGVEQLLQIDRDSVNVVSDCYHKGHC